MSRTLTTIGFDADDTLWHHERYFQLTTDRFVELLKPHADPHHLREHLLAAERQNVRQYEFGVKGFTLSMIETAVEVTGGAVPGSVIGDILKASRQLLAHPVEPYPGVADALGALAKTHKLVLVTRGDLFDQERKLAASGLGDFFAEVEIVSDKTAEVYARVFARHGDGPERALMVGNSMRADIVPALAAGAWAVHVPSEHEWALDTHDDPTDVPRFRRLASLGELLPLVQSIG